MGYISVKLADRKGPKSYISELKVESSTKCDTNEALPAPGLEIYSWPGREDVAQLDNRLGSFGDECDEKENGRFLEYSWENIGIFDDLDNMFRFIKHYKRKPNQSKVLKWRIIGYVYLFTSDVLMKRYEPSVSLCLQSWTTLAEQVRTVLKEYPKLRLTPGRKVRH
ncbi:hypothetical protein IFM89_011102 [Coptis chinensis]|uniref:Uncharacterized protein n=1 Tax=Coptis chinensis TaxID=261450 RepID=A0A835IPL5_9MAGN|nr:hypothetical protein IFM89_011102 [Coptis chinensis]